MNGQSRYTLQEVSRHNGENGSRTWIMIYDMIYDVTEYKGKHPGGSELIEEFAGKDATAGFDEFGHSTDAKRMLKDFLVGELVDEDKMANRKKKQPNYSAMKTGRTVTGGRRTFLRLLFGKCS